MKRIGFCLALLLSLFKIGFSATGKPELARRTWVFPENETVSASSTTTKKPDACEIRDVSSGGASTPKKGFCLKLTDCSSLRGNLRNRTNEPFICYYEGSVPIICCPNSANQPPKNLLPPRNLTVFGKPELARRTWVFPENETVPASSITTKKPDACEIRDVSSGRASTPKKGFCLKLTDCSSLRGNLRNRTNEPFICYYEGSVPIICCPNSANQPPQNLLPPRNLTVFGKPELARRTWVFPENETVPASSITTKKPDACEIRDVSSGRASTPKKGFCLKLTDCSSLRGNLRNRTNEPFICYYEGSVPIICCPNSANQPPKNLLPPRNLTVFGCGIRPGTGLRFVRSSYYKPVVVGGREAAPFSWPWMVAIFRKTGNTYKYHCGAALISNKYILSAAHCFAGGRLTKNPNDYAIRLRIHERNDGVLHNLTSIKLHENYNPKLHYNDIAILKLKNVLPSQLKAVPICLPPNNSKQAAGTQVTVTGWGATSFGGRDSNTLQEAELRVFSNRECNNSYSKIDSKSFPSGITSNMMCAGQKSGGKDACQGDSGGPLVYQDGATWSLLGVVSFGYGCAQEGFPGIYTRVSSYINWIAANTNNLS